MSNPYGQFVWYELMTTDPKAATAFYEQVVGWKGQDAGMPEPYTLMMAGSHHIGGLMGLPPEAAAMGAPSAWVGYLSVADVDAAAQAVQADGGTLCRPADDIPGVGRFAVVMDPQGATFMLFKDAGGTPLPPLPPGTPGTVGWHELHAGDGATAFDFYAKHFGWTKTTGMDMGPMGIYQLFAAGGADIGGMMTKMPEQPVPAWLFYFYVDSIAAAVQRVNQAGGQVVNGPMEVPGGEWIINGIDPQGAMFSLVGPKG
jgi:uncharacterized protein